MRICRSAGLAKGMAGTDVWKWREVSGAGAERERGQERDLLGHQEGGCVYSECDGQRLAGWSHRVLIWPTIQSHSSCLEELRSFPRDLRAGESPTFASDRPVRMERVTAARRNSC